MSCGSVEAYTAPLQLSNVHGQKYIYIYIISALNPSKSMLQTFRHRDLSVVLGSTLLGVVLTGRDSQPLGVTPVGRRGVWQPSRSKTAGSAMLVIAQLRVALGLLGGSDIPQLESEDISRVLYLPPSGTT